MTTYLGFSSGWDTGRLGAPDLAAATGSVGYTPSLLSSPSGSPDAGGAEGCGKFQIKERSMVERVAALQ